MQTEVIGTHSDEQIVEAVRGGNVERYRELVERYERLVYAVAWSRLGDPDLAEEATQEAFIRGYRGLGLLNRGGKFGPWISSIARRVAINLGFRNRRELNKRERWALEQEPSTVERSGDEPECTPETLRQTLAELPYTHRECLVLFYLEGKSGAEAAGALGVSETAFRVRLHRARGVLREQLETKLESSLEKLRPAKSLVPAVMAAILASSSAKAATGGTVAVGLGAKVLSTLSKSALFAWFVPMISVLGLLPGLAMAWWWGRMDRQNYREADGFRARLHRGFYRSFFWGYPLLVVLIFVLIQGAQAAWGIRGMFLFLGLFLMWPTLLAARLLVIQRNSFQIGMIAYSAIILAGMFATWLGWIPLILSQMPLLIATILFALVLNRRPVRMDYSLLLRAARGLLKTAAGEEAPVTRRLDRQSLLAFGRFLGSRWLASNYRWETRGLALRLPPVRTRFLTNIALTFVPMSSGCSSVLLGWDGTIFARCDRTDAADLAAMEHGSSIDPGELERLVERAVGEAWRKVRNGDFAMAERLLGELPEHEVFVVAPARSAATRWMRWLLAAFAVLAALGIGLSWRLDKQRPASGRYLKSVSVTEAEIRATLAQLDGPRAQNKLSELERDLAYIGDARDVLPPTNLFTPAAWQRVRERCDELLPKTPVPDTTFARLQRLVATPALSGMFLNDWWPDEFGPDPAATRQAIAEAPPQARQGWFKLSEVIVSSREGTNQNYTALNTHSLARLARCFQKLGCLDAVDGTATVETLLRHQVLSKQLPPGRRQELDPKLLHGTFLCFGFDPIEETWQSLVILEAFGALNRVDREACAKGILRFHHGKGLFGSVREGDGFVIFGHTRDTLCAFESLRILNALDRVKDLDQWEFRPMFVSKPATNSTPRAVTLEEMEAWVCQQRFGRILRERKENPQAPTRSLLQP